MLRTSIPFIVLLAALTAGAQDQTLSNPQGNTIVVVGSVAKPGVYSLSGAIQPFTVIDALARAGGLFRTADHRAYILRTDKDGNKHLLEVPLRDIIDRREPDVALEAGDVLQIPNDPS
jgi:protein involved in polysaccharide export with SLBB domain